VSIARLVDRTKLLGDLRRSNKFDFDILPNRTAGCLNLARKGSLHRLDVLKKSFPSNKFSDVAPIWCIIIF